MAKVGEKWSHPMGIRFVLNRRRAAYHMRTNLHSSPSFVDSRFREVKPCAWPNSVSRPSGEWSASGNSQGRTWIQGLDRGESRRKVVASNGDSLCAKPEESRLPREKSCVLSWVGCLYKSVAILCLCGCLQGWSKCDCVSALRAGLARRTRCGRSGSAGCGGCAPGVFDAPGVLRIDAPCGRTVRTHRGRAADVPDARRTHHGCTGRDGRVACNRCTVCVGCN